MRKFGIHRLALQRRLQISGLREFSCFALGLGAGLLACVALLAGAGVPTAELFNDLLKDVFATGPGLAQTLTLAVPLVLAGLASAIAMRLKFWNIGVEGQLWLGAIGATAVALNGIGPEPLRLPLMLLTSALFGALWIGVPLLLKLRLQVSELVVTLLLSNVAFLLMQHLLFGVWRDPASSFPMSSLIAPDLRLSQLGFGNLHSGVWIVLVVTVLLTVLLERSRAGLQATAIGFNPLSAKACGLPVTATVVGMVLLSGALAGLAGGLIISGTEYRLTQNIGFNMTFSGIVVAFVARFKPLWVLLSAFALAGLYNIGDSLKVFYGLSDAIVVLIQGVVLMCLLIAQFFRDFRLDLQREPG